MRRNTMFLVAALLALSSAASAETRGLVVPKPLQYMVDSLAWRSRGTPERRDTIIGTSTKDTSQIIPIAGLKSWAVMFKYTDAPGPTTSGTWAVRCTLQVSVDTTNWFSVSPGPVWALTASRDTTVYHVYFTKDLQDSGVGIVNGILSKRQIAAAGWARFVLTMGNSADDTVYIQAISARMFDPD